MLGRADAVTATRSASDPAPRASSGLVIAVLALCGTVAALQQTVVIAVLPQLPRLLDTSVDNASWVVTTTLLAGAVATPTVSRFADMVGKRRMIMVCLALMVTGSVVGGLAQSLQQVLAARALQGVGTALIPVGIAAMRDTLPRDRIPLGVALMSGTLAIGAGAGLPLSGLLVQYLDWHLLFWVPAVLGAVMLVTVPLVLPPPAGPRTHRRFDLRGAVLLSGVLTTLLLALSKGGQWGWTSPATLGCATAGVVLLAIWVPLQLRTAAPLVDLRVAARPRVLLVNVASVFVGFAMFANMLVTTQLCQLPTGSGGLGLTTLQTGLVMAPTALTFGLMAPVAAGLIRRIGPVVALLAGALGMAAAYAGRSFLSHELWQVLLGSLLVSLGTSVAYAAMPTLIMRSVPRSETASANGLNTLMRSVGTSVASAATAAVVTAGATVAGGVVVPDSAALLGVFWIAAAASVAAACAAAPLVRLGAADVADEDDEDDDVGRFAEPASADVTVAAGAGRR